MRYSYLGLLHPPCGRVLCVRQMCLTPVQHRAAALYSPQKEVAASRPVYHSRRRPPPQPGEGAPEQQVCHTYLL